MQGQDAVVGQEGRAEQRAEFVREARVVQGVQALDATVDLLLAAAEVHRKQHRRSFHRHRTGNDPEGFATQLGHHPRVALGVRRGCRPTRYARVSLV